MLNFSVEFQAAEGMVLKRRPRNECARTLRLFFGEDLRSQPGTYLGARVGVVKSPTKPYH